MKVIVGGTRTFDNYDLMEEKLDRIFSGISELTICHANAPGADKVAEWWAFKHRKTVMVFHPEKRGKDKMGKNCDHIAEMIEQADAAVIFWDGCSDGSKRLIDHCKEAGLRIRVIKYTGGGFSSYYKNTEKYKCKVRIIKKKSKATKPKSPGKKKFVLIRSSKKE